ncbi:MAG: hypothetical protein EKK31_30620 [Hyphomicrobiales bacterium]|nr:MAG: hypothetical protein EKK31_30620 [Hyphomicrobiales bacterium]
MPMKFVAHHLWDSVKWESDPAHGRAARQRTARPADDPSATVELVDADRMAKLEGKFNTPGVRSALKIAVRPGPRALQRKSA